MRETFDDIGELSVERELLTEFGGGGINFFGCFVCVNDDFLEARKV